MEILDFLNKNSGALMVIFTSVVTLSTLVYAILTVVLVRETRKLREVQTEPKIEILLKHREEFINIVNLYVRNIGLGPAYYIHFESKVLEGGEAAEELIGDLTKVNFFKTGLRYLGPGQEVKSHYSQMTKNYDGKVNSIIEFFVNYRSATGKGYSERFCIDMSEFKGFVEVGKPPLYAISKSLEAIEKDMHNVLTGFKRIRTDIYTEEDREREKKEQEELFEEIKSNKGS